jgi:hypothetical protein
MNLTSRIKWGHYMKPSNVSQVLDSFFENNYPLLLSGSPGTAKTALIEQSAKRINYDHFTMLLSQSDPTDAKGYPAIIDNKGEFVPFAEIYQIITAKSPTIVFFDDMGQALPSVQAAFMNFLNSRTFNGKPISKHVRFVGATNGRQDKAASHGIIEPAKSRFYTIIPVEPDVEDFRNWGIANDLDEMLLAYCRYTEPDKVFNFKPTNDLTNTASPRTIHHLSDIIKMNFPSNLRHELYTGAVGQQFTDGFLSFCEIAPLMPDYREVFIDPHTATVPDRPDVLYALIAQLVSATTHSNINQVKTYSDRLVKNKRQEFAVSLMMDIRHRNETLCETQAFTTWQLENPEVFSFNH